jgi:iron(III) transport system ATP-binding protein
MADRIVVMNQGGIDQVGTPREIYETPVTPFVADFIGKVNVLAATAEGGGRFRVGSLSLAVARPDVASGTAVKLYLRPEDVAVSVNGALAGVANAVPGTVAKIEFLGAFCMVGVRLDGSGGSPLVANVPRQQVDAGGLAPGAPVTVSLPPTAMRILG